MVLSHDDGLPGSRSKGTDTYRNGNLRTYHSPVGYGVQVNGDAPARWCQQEATGLPWAVWDCAPTSVASAVRGTGDTPKTPILLAKHGSFARGATIGTAQPTPLTGAPTPAAKTSARVVEAFSMEKVTCLQESP